MFLFLSKLLPLVIYPLGFACCLMLVALGLLWRFPRWAAIAIAVAVLELWVFSSGLVASALVGSLEGRAVALQERTSGLPYGSLPTADAIVVLGGATKSALPPRPWVDLAEEGDRVLYGAKLYGDGKAPKLIMSGGRIDWIGQGGAPESADMATIAEAMGVPARDILQDPTSLNTRQNAENVAKILQQYNLKKILLVTSAMHMPRSYGIFKRLGMEAIAAPTDFWVTEGDWAGRTKTKAAIALNLLPDAENLRGTTRALKEYIGLMVYWLRGWV